jgi:hypothetical protein
MITQQNSDTLSLVISFGSGAIAIWAIIEAKRAAQESNRLQSRIVLIETERERDRLDEKNHTAVEASFASRRLILRNVGARPAHDVEVFVDGSPRTATDLIGRDKPQVLELLGVGAEIAYHVRVYDAMKRDYRIRVTWRNVEGNSESWESLLELP